MSENNPKLLSALALAERGFYVFRLRPNDKKPLKGWQDEATRDPDTIRKLFGTKIDYNIGIYTAKFGTSGAVAVVDVDTKEGRKGQETMDEHDMFGRDFVPTLRVATASGGYHLFYLTELPLSSGANKLGLNVDVKSSGAYVVGPGSTIDGKTYVAENMDTPLANCPQWVIDWVGYPQPRDTGTANEDQDTPAMVARAIAYLTQTAPKAVKGSGRNNTFYRVAAEIRDYGISQPMAADLIWKHYNPTRSQPPYEYERIETVVNSAYTYAKGAAGALDPKLVFQPIPGDGAEAPVNPKLRGRFPAPSPQFLGQVDSASIPPREWLMERYLLKGAVTSIVAPGGVGKSLLSISLALSLATEKSILDIAPIHQAKSWLINNEDDVYEIQRRVAAAAIRHDLDPKEFGYNILIQAGTINPITIAFREDRAVKASPHVDDIIAQIRADGIELLVIDPLAEVHEANENDNMEMKRVMSFIRRIAHECHIAVLVIHHTKKPQQASSETYAGSADAGRGASSIKDSARINLTLMEASPRDGKEYGLSESERHKYVRLDDAKMNLAARTSEPRWFKRESVRLNNGDSVGVLVPVQLAKRKTEVWEALPQAVAGILDVICPGQTSGEVSAYAIAEKLEEDPFFCDYSLTKIQKEVMKSFAVPYPIGNRMIESRLREKGQAKKFIVFSAVGSNELRQSANGEEAL